MRICRSNFCKIKWMLWKSGLWKKARRFGAKTAAACGDSASKLGSFPSSLMESERGQDLGEDPSPPGLEDLLNAWWCNFTEAYPPEETAVSPRLLATVLSQHYFSIYTYHFFNICITGFGHIKFTAWQSPLIFAIFYSPIKKYRCLYFQLTEFPYTKHKRGHCKSYIQSVYLFFKANVMIINPKGLPCLRHWCPHPGWTGGLPMQCTILVHVQVASVPETTPKSGTLPFGQSAEAEWQF